MASRYYGMSDSEQKDDLVIDESQHAASGGGFARDDPTEPRVPLPADSSKHGLLKKFNRKKRREIRNERHAYVKRDENNLGRLKEMFGSNPKERIVPYNGNKRREDRNRRRNQRIVPYNANKRREDRNRRRNHPDANPLGRSSQVGAPEEISPHQAADIQDPDPDPEAVPGHDPTRDPSSTQETDQHTDEDPSETNQRGLGRSDKFHFGFAKFTKRYRKYMNLLADDPRTQDKWLRHIYEVTHSF